MSFTSFTMVFCASFARWHAARRRQVRLYIPEGEIDGDKSFVNPGLVKPVKKGVFGIIQSSFGKPCGINQFINPLPEPRQFRNGLLPKSGGTLRSAQFP